MDAFRSNLSHYLCDANEVVFFKLVREVSDLEKDDGFFHPDMSHQIFGEKEQIFGYSNLRINIFYSASFLHACVQVSYTKKIDPRQSEGVEADDLMSKLKEVLPKNVITNVDDFSLILQKEKSFKPYGELIDGYSRKVHSAHCSFEIYKADPSIPKFLEYHARMESFILWFIDAASYIDVDDDKWDYYVIYEKFVENTESRYAFVGYSTCYRFYAYPDKCRPRISQVLVLPPYQRQGHCSSLISAIYCQYVPLSNVLDITAEDPSENFQRVRDFVDAKNCSTLKEFSPSNLHLHFTNAMEKAARENFKINKRQARRVYEILRLQRTNINDDAEFTKYRLAIKSRISHPMQQLRRKCPFIEQNPLLLPPLEERHAILQREFESCIEEYAKVIARLESS